MAPCSQSHHVFLLSSSCRSAIHQRLTLGQLALRFRPMLLLIKFILFFPSLISFCILHFYHSHHSFLLSLSSRRCHAASFSLLCMLGIYSQLTRGDWKHLSATPSWFVSTHTTIKHHLHKLGLKGCFALGCFVSFFLWKQHCSTLPPVKIAHISMWLAPPRMVAAAISWSACRAPALDSVMRRKYY